jgi:hypothetical protein
MIILATQRHPESIDSSLLPNQPKFWYLANLEIRNNLACQSRPGSLHSTVVLPFILPFMRHRWKIS